MNAPPSLGVSARTLTGAHKALDKALAAREVAKSKCQKVAQSHDWGRLLKTEENYWSARAAVRRARAALKRLTPKEGA